MIVYTQSRICEHCGDLVISPCFCKGPPPNAFTPQVIDEQGVDVAVYHSLWAECHGKQDANPEWFAGWCGRVPSIGCGCREWLKDYLVANPPDFGEGWFEWIWRLHNAVNTKLGKPSVTSDEASAIYLRII